MHIDGAKPLKFPLFASETKKWVDLFFDANPRYKMERTSMPLDRAVEVLNKIGNKPWDQIARVLNVSMVLDIMNSHRQKKLEFNASHVSGVMYGLQNLLFPNQVTRERHGRILGLICSALDSNGFGFTNNYQLIQAIYGFKGVNLRDESAQKLLDALLPHLLKHVKTMNARDVGMCLAGLKRLDQNNSTVMAMVKALKDGVDIDKLNCKTATLLLANGHDERVFQWLESSRDIEDSYVGSLVFYHYYHNVPIPKWLEEKYSSLRINAGSASDAERCIKAIIEKGNRGYQICFNHYLYGLECDIYIPKNRMNIEYDGVQHETPYHIIADDIRDTFLRGKRIKVVRYSSLEDLLNRFLK